jgi:hypothetical protein
LVLSFDGDDFQEKIAGWRHAARFQLSSDAAKFMVPGPTPVDEGLAELRAAILRLQQEPHRARNPVFGDVSKEEWNQIHLKHASLHMSFLVPEQVVYAQPG